MLPNRLAIVNSFVLLPFTKPDVLLLFNNWRWLFSCCKVLGVVCNVAGLEICCCCCGVGVEFRIAFSAIAFKVFIVTFCTFTPAAAAAALTTSAS